MIDILMTTYNGSQFIAEQIDSILAQDHSDFRLIIRDDSSSDNTVELIRRYKTDSRVCLLEDDLGNLGASSSFMQLIKESNAPFFMLSDQDDIWLKDKISRSLEKICSMAQRFGAHMPMLVFTDLTVTDANARPTYESFWKHQKLDPALSKNWKKLLAQNVVTGSTIIANDSVKPLILPYPLKEMLYDHWIAVNVAKHGRVGYLPIQTVLYRQHGTNVEGARKAGLRYGLRKAPGLLGSIRLYRKLAGFFGDVSVSKLIFYKITINLKRIFV